MKEIGGYFELELKNSGEYYKDLIALNSARNSLEYILLTKEYKKIYIPYYTCDVILEPIKKLNIEFEYYNIDSNLEPIFNKNLLSNEVFLYTNYFGIKDSFIKKIVKSIKNIIIDNSQAFFSTPIKGIDSFYSARKFFGVSDGAYLHTDKNLNYKIKQDKSYDRMTHLLKRVDLSAMDGYSDFKNSDNSLNNQNIKEMSKLTKKILASIDYTNVISIRQSNFLYLHQKLKDKNELTIEITNETPMCYPFLFKSEYLRAELIKNRVYVATYWPNVIESSPENSKEYYLAKYLLPLPIDQRYDINDMNMILSILDSKC
ncbi:hypothetical protein JXR93_02080 [bacterium]|nr:hypothetical protein [bacterium]